MIKITPNNGEKYISANMLDRDIDSNYTDYMNN